MVKKFDKLTPLAEAVAAVKDGDAITAGGFAHSHQPMAFIRALIREGRRDLTIIGMAECWVAEFLSAAGLLRRAYMSNFMFEGLGRCRQFSAGVESGAIEVEDHSHYGIVCRFMAAGLGLPFMPLRAMAGTDILETPGFEPPEKKARTLASPFGADAVTVVSPLVPDVAIIHAAQADRRGNTRIFGTTSVIEEQVKAARHVIVTAEEIVETDRFRRAPETTLLPGFMVDAVVHLPFGAHPTGVYGYYDHDAPHLDDYYAASRSPETVAGYLDRFVREPADHWAYLDRVGMSRLMRLRVDPALGYRMEGASDA